MSRIQTDAKTKKPKGVRGKIAKKKAGEMKDWMTDLGELLHAYSLPTAGSLLDFLDKATADREDFALGDTVAYVTDVGQFEGALVGTIGTEDTDSLFGATIVALDLPTALASAGARVSSGSLGTQTRPSLRSDSDISVNFDWKSSACGMHVGRIWV